MEDLLLHLGPEALQNGSQPVAAESVGLRAGDPGPELHLAHEIDPGRIGIELGERERDLRNPWGRFILPRGGGLSAPDRRSQDESGTEPVSHQKEKPVLK
jgi:hypothetical protein